MASGEQPLLVLHCDLPLLSADDISAVLASQRALDGLVVGCDRHGSGTNLLAFGASTAPHFCFGANSCAGHVASAQGAGFPAQILQRSGIAVDVDEPADLKCVMDRLHFTPTSNTAALLHNTELGGRIKLAQATMTGSSDAVDDVNRGLLN